MQECKTCGLQIADGEPTVVVGGFPLHEACARTRAEQLSGEGADVDAAPIGEAPVTDRGPSAGR